MVEALLVLGAEVSQRAAGGFTALHTAAGGGDVALRFYYGFTDDSKQDAYSTTAIVGKVCVIEADEFGSEEADVDSDGAAQGRR